VRRGSTYCAKSNRWKTVTFKPAVSREPVERTRPGGDRNLIVDSPRRQYGNPSRSTYRPQSPSGYPLAFAATDGTISNRTRHAGSHDCRGWRPVRSAIAGSAATALERPDWRARARSRALRLNSPASTIVLTHGARVGNGSPARRPEDEEGLPSPQSKIEAAAAPPPPRTGSHAQRVGLIAEADCARRGGNRIPANSRPKPLT